MRKTRKVMEMYIVEKSDGSEAARWKNLLNPNWPDGVSQSGRSKAGDSRKGEDGETYTIKEVLQKTEGDGPRTVMSGIRSLRWEQLYSLEMMGMTTVHFVDGNMQTSYPSVIRLTRS